MSGFNAGMRGLARIGIPMAKIVKKETGELIKTLVNVSPAADARKIKDDITRKFELQRLDINPKFPPGKTSKTGLQWVSVNEHYLTGISPTLDERNASVEELKQLSYHITKKGRIRKPFMHPRTDQKVLLLAKILTKESTVKRLAAAKAKNRGRLKASWMAAVRDGKIVLSSGRLMPPQWVKNHVNSGIRGYARDNTNSDTSPSFTIASYAKGLKFRAERFFVQNALNIRAKAMAQNAANYFKRKKNVADYART